MKASFNKRTWFKITSILVVGTFVFQANAYALSYHKRDILPDDHFTTGLIGFVVTMVIPFVPQAAGALGSALSLTESGTKVLGAAMGAGLGATPGLVAGDDTSAIIGGISGGLSGHFKTSDYIKMSSAPAMQQYANNLAISMSTQTVSSILTDVAVRYWKWEPEHAHALGMVAGTVTGWTMASAMPGGQEMMRDMYQDNPKWAKWVTPGAETFAPWKAGLVTGLGLGSIQAGIDIYLSNILEDADIPDSAKYRLASLGSNTLGSLAWGGIAGGTEGIKSVANDQFYNSLIRQGLSIYISWKVEEDWGWEPEKASILGSSASMLLANLPIWLQGPQPIEAERLRGRARDLQTEANSLREQAEKYKEVYSGKPAELTPVDPNTWITQAKVIEARAGRNISEADRLESLHFNRLRQPTPITSKVGWDAVLEPLIYYEVSSLVTDLSKDRTGEYKTGADLIVYNLAAMNAASLTHAGIVALVNQQGWDGFGQVYMVKTREFQGDLLSFGSQAFGGGTSGRRDVAIGASNIYGAAQRNSQMWDLAGLSGFAAVRATKTSTSPSLFTAMATHAGGLARYHTVRNLEGLAYTASKTLLWPYDLFRLERDLAEDLEANNPKLFEEINRRWIEESSYPAYSPSPAKIRFPSWSIGRDPETEELILENTVTERTYPLPLTSEGWPTSEEWQEWLKHNVNRPFEYEPRTEIPLTQPTTYIPSY